MKEKIKELLREWRDKRKIRDNLNLIKEKAYQEEMKKQAVIMGKKQAELEAKTRAEIYEEKLNYKKEKFKESLKKKEDLFRLKDNPQGHSRNKTYSLITGKWG